MRVLLSALVVLLALSTASATLITAEPGRKWQATSCRAPINQITCKINPDGFVEGIQYGAWGPITGYTPAPFLPGGGNLYYTQSWCGPFGLQNRCSNSGQSTTDAVVTMPNTWNAGPPPTATVTFVKGMTICYGKKVIRGITWNLQTFTVGWEQVGTNPPQAVVTPGATSVQTCGVTTGCKIESTYNAPDNKVLGGIETKCKLTQGWFKYVSNGQYHNRLFIDKIDKVCLTDPMPRPIGRFEVCDACQAAGGPNTPNIADCDAYYGLNQCPCKK